MPDEASNVDISDIKTMLQLRTVHSLAAGTWSEIKSGQQVWKCRSRVCGLDRLWPHAGHTRFLLGA